jgi:integrase
MKVLEDLLNSMKSGKVMTPYQPRIFPKVISQKFNVEIKKLLVKIGIDEPVKVISMVNGKSVVKYAQKGDLISSHTGRRTYITLCLQQGISPHILMKTTGHRKISTLLKYNKETEININDEFFKKINTSGK